MHAETMLFRADFPRSLRSSARLAGLALGLCVGLLTVPYGGAALGRGLESCLSNPTPSCLLEILRKSAEAKIQAWARAESFSSLGAAYARSGFTAEADRSFAEAIASARRREPLLPGLSSLTSIAEKLAEIGRTEEARLLTREVAAMTSGALHSNRQSADVNEQLIYWLRGHARLQRSLGDTQGALESLEAAAEWTGPAPPPLRVWTSQLVGIAYEQVESGDPAAAKRSLERAAHLAIRIEERPTRVRRLFSVLNHRIRFGFFEPATDTQETLRAELRTIDTDGGPPDPAYVRGWLAYLLLWRTDSRFSPESEFDKGLPTIPIREPAQEDLGIDACFDSPAVPCLIRTMTGAAKAVATAAEKGGMLSRLAVVQAQAGWPDLAAGTFDEAYTVFTEISDSGLRIFQLEGLVPRLVQAGFEERARDLREYINRARFAEIEKGEPTETNWLSGFMADAHGQMTGKWPGAPQEALRNAAKAAAILQAQGKDVTAASGEIAELTARTGDREEAGRIFDELRSDLSSRSDQPEKFWALSSLAARETDAGFVDRARTTLKLAHDVHQALTATDVDPTTADKRVVTLMSGLLDTFPPK